MLLLMFIFISYILQNGFFDYFGEDEDDDDDDSEFHDDDKTPELYRCIL